MAVKSDPHIFSGMQRDASISKHSSEFLYDALNIRLTVRDGDTMLSMTNEKGTLTMSLVDRAGNPKSMVGTYLGHCVINDKVVVFTTDSDSALPDCIYVVYPDSSCESAIVDLVYVGVLNFDANYPIESLGVYENEHIQKVYWVDGKNSPRMINIYGEDDNGTFKYRYINPRIPDEQGGATYLKADSQFNFISTLDLKEEIKITRIDNNGMFAPGVIQYAFAYFNKYGQESNIFYVSSLKYISFTKRGAAPDERVSNTFTIEVKNFQNNFDYLRVFSIHRTSLDAVPIVKRVEDVDIRNIEEDSIITVVDDGRKGNTIDPTELLYIGGEDIVASTIAQKDNTLFLGDLKLNRPAIDNSIKEWFRLDSPNITQDAHGEYSVWSKTEGNRAFTIQTYLQDYSLPTFDTSTGYYSYTPTLNGACPGFKVGDHYRLGIQFQHKTGSWSEPVFITDYILPHLVHPSINKDPLVASTTSTLSMPSIQLSIAFGADDPLFNTLYNAGYRRVRPVCVFPTIGDRLVLTQGMLCPTVYSVYHRKAGTPFAQSSWYLRPFIPNSVLDETPSSYNEHGNIVEFEHLAPLGHDGGRNTEIQGAALTIRSGALHVNEEDESKAFFVDQSILTMHSPEIEFDDEFSHINSTNYNLRLVGAIKFTASVGDIDIQTSTPANNKEVGFDKHAFGVLNSSNQAGRSLVAGAFWKDKIIYTGGSEGKEYKTDKSSTSYMVYPWHRTGSLNNDEVRPASSGTRTAVLQKKKMSNLKFSDSNFYFGSNNILTYGISPIQLFDSDNLDMLKVPYPDPSLAIGDVNYYGNIDTLLNNTAALFGTGSATIVTTTSGQGTTSSTAYNWTQNFSGPIVKVGTNDEDNPDEAGGKLGGDVSCPVRMKYKSSRHLLFSLNASNSNPVILPHIKDSNNNNITNDVGGRKDSSLMFWVTQAQGGAPSSSTMVHHWASSVEELNDWDTWNNTASRHDNGVLANVGDYIIINPGGTSGSILLGYVVDDTSERPEEAWTIMHPRQDWYYHFICSGNSYNGHIYQGKDSALVDIGTIQPRADYYTVSQKTITLNSGENIDNPFLFLGELYKEPNPDTDFGGNTEEAIKANLWIPAGEPVSLDSDFDIKFTEGDTWFQRYDCLKTYPFTLEDENSIVEIGSFLCETRVNIDGRYDRNRGNTSNLVTTPVNFNLLNDIYSQSNNFFNYRILDKDFYEIDEFRNSITWSKEKQAAADVDLWTNITMANVLDLDGNYGKVNALKVSNDTIFCFQDTAISRILFNSRVQIPTSDGVPIEITNSYKVDGKEYLTDKMGCSNKWSIVNTASGIYFIDSVSSQLYNLGKEFAAISGAHGFRDYFTKIDRGVWNPINWDGPRLFYDDVYNDLYIVGKDFCLVFSEILGQFTSFMSYDRVPSFFNVKNNFIAFNYENSTPKLYKMWGGEYNNFFGVYKPFNFTFISNADSTEDKIFTNVEMEVDFKNSIGEYEHSKYLDYIRAWNEYQDTTDTMIHNPNYAIPSKHYPEAGAKKKFRVWRVDIPRAFDETNNIRTLQRIRNTWTKIKFGIINNNITMNKNSMELHSLSVQYHI